MIKLWAIPLKQIRSANPVRKVSLCKLLHASSHDSNVSCTSLRQLHTSRRLKIFEEMTVSHVDSTTTLDESMYFSASHSLRSSSEEDVERLLELLDEVISYHDKQLSSWVVENKVRTFVLSYGCLLQNHKEDVVKRLASAYSVNHGKVLETLKQLKNQSLTRPLALSDEKQLKDVLTPLYAWLFQIISRLEGGVKFLVDMRRDVLSMLRDTSLKAEYSVPLKQLNSNLKDLLSLWFSVGFLNLERITWKSSCEMLQKISEYEAVHPVRSWTDLKRRVGPNRRCFVYTHNSMPSEPIVVLHTALCPEIASSTQGIVAATQKASVANQTFEKLPSDSSVVEDVDRMSSAIFYSITSTQPGLQGIELGNYLIKRVVLEVQAEFPHISQFATLSPIPTFKKWLFKKLMSLENGDGEPRLLHLWQTLVHKFGGWNDLKKHLHNNTWAQNPTLVDDLKAPLMATCAHYLYNEKNRGMALDNVANFHLKNGAVMWRLNWMADMSPRGMTNSCGLMVNYRYFLEDTEKNSRRYLENKTISATEHIQSLAGEKLVSKL